MLEWAILKDTQTEDIVQEEGSNKENEVKDSEKEVKKEEPKKEVQVTKPIHIKSVSFQTTSEKFELTLKNLLKDSFVSCNLVQGLQNHKGFGFV